jgi:fatty acid desaturase
MRIAVSFRVPSNAAVEFPSVPGTVSTRLLAAPPRAASDKRQPTVHARARSMDAGSAIDQARSSPIAKDELALLQQRSDARGLLRLAGHLIVIAGAAALHTFSLHRSPSLLIHAASALVLGFPLVTMFATMHECVHKTAFKSRWLNDAVGFFAGLLSFYNSTFYWPYHVWHHRYTQLPGQDPELEDPKPTSYFSYFLELSALPWWLGKLRLYLKLALGQFGSYGFLNDKSGPPTVRSVRLQLLTYAIAISVSVWLGYPYFVVYWLVPVALAQPLLRAILLGEHMGCSNDADMLSNTRTTYTVWLVRFLMWEMPYHAEHHRYPALPFFSLARAHGRLEPYLSVIERQGYSGLHLGLLKAFRKSPAIVPNQTPTGGSK